MPTIEEIRRFWDEKAEKLKTDCTATLGEVGLRELEIRTIERYLRDGTRVVDIGCGNGFSTIEFAKTVKAEFLGIDYSEKMIHYAKENLKQIGNLRGAVSFEIEDVLRLKAPEILFDVAITERCLQNLPSWEEQRQAVVLIAQTLIPGGILIMTEGSVTGLDRLNRLRAMIGKPELEGVIPWHNRFFDDEQLTNDSTIRQVFDIVKIDHFCSTYMFLTRVISPKLAGFALRMPNLGSFGYVKAYVWQRREYRGA